MKHLVNRRKKMSEEDSKNLKEIKELLESIDKKTTAYMDAKLRRDENEIRHIDLQTRYLKIIAGISG